jgi:hypothetical protein
MAKAPTAQGGRGGLNGFASDVNIFSHIKFSVQLNQNSFLLSLRKI